MLMKKLVDNEDFAKNSYLVIFFENLIIDKINKYFTFLYD